MAVWVTPPITPVVTAGAYSQNDSVGGVITIPGVPIQGTIMSVVIQDDGDQGNSFEAYFFRTEPAGVADNAAFGLTDADGGLICGAVILNTWFDLTGSQVLSVDNIGLPYSTADGNLFMMLKADDASPPTYAATDDIHVTLGIVY